MLFNSNALLMVFLPAALFVFYGPWRPSETFKISVLILASFVLVANVQEIVRGVRSFGRATGTPIVAALPAAVARNRRLYGGLVAHIGVAIAAIAITTSSAFARQTEVTLSRGQQTSFVGYVLRYEGLTVERQPQRTVDVARVSVWRQGRMVGQVIPSLNTYPSAPNDPIGTPSIRYGGSSLQIHSIWSSAS